MRSLIKDIFLSIFLLSIFGGAGYLFYEDLHGEISNEGGEVIGEIIFIENGAQRKFSGRAVWGELETSTPVYNYDSLRTIDDAQAIIKLIDGTEITMAANTYIVLEWGEEARSIEFLGGNISAAASESTLDLQIKSEDTVIALNKANITLDKQDGEEINLSVDEGTIDITKDGETTNIEENFRASISDIIIVEQDAVKLKLPSNNRLIITTSAAVPLGFRWESILPLNNPRFEITENKDFSELTDYELGRNSESYAIDTLPGTYYWRISGEFSDGAQYHSPANRVVIIRDKAPKQQVPEVDEVFEYRTTAPDLAFSWEASPLANGSGLQIATDSGFINLVNDISGPNNFSTISTLAEGSYYWKVIPKYTAADLIAYANPEVRRFFIEKNDSQEPTQLIIPAADEKVNPLKTKDGLRFSWKVDREIGSYHILISENRDMIAPLIDQWLSRNSYLMEELPAQGDYYWMVEGLDKENKAVPPSELRKFTVLDAILSIDTVKPAADSLSIVESFDNINFGWESTMDGPYRVKVFRKNSAGLPLVNQISNTTSMNLVLPGQGEYYWQVSVLDQNEDIVLSSPQASFEMVQRLNTPDFKAPDEEERISLLGSTPLSMEWRPVAGASYYSAELIPDNTAFPRVQRESSAETQWNISDKRNLRTGGYTLQVQAHSPLEDGIINSSRRAVRSFNLDSVQAYGAPRLTYPVEGQNISRLSIIDNKPSFRWAQSPVLERQRIRLSKDPEFSSLILDDDLKTLSRLIPDLDEGRYYLQLLSEDSKGNKSPDSPVYSFSVSPIPPLSGVKNYEPLSEQIIDMQNRDDLRFSWTPVPKTTYYRIALYPEGSGKAVFKEEKWSRTQYNFNKLEKLNIGRFNFEVQAVREMGGKIFQESSVLSVPFELTLPEIADIPDILSPELQYAH
jgi:FecR protein